MGGCARLCGFCMQTSTQSSELVPWVVAQVLLCPRDCDKEKPCGSCGGLKYVDEDPQVSVLKELTGQDHLCSWVGELPTSRGFRDPLDCYDWKLWGGLQQLWGCSCRVMPQPCSCMGIHTQRYSVSRHTQPQLFVQRNFQSIGHIALAI